MDVVISETKAKIYIAIGWIYSVLLSLTRLAVDRFEYNIPGHGRIIWAISTLILIIVVMAFQTSTYLKLRKRISMAVGSVQTPHCRNTLYMRAMKKSTLVALCFSIAWAPYCIMILCVDWTSEDYVPAERTLGAPLLALSLLQGFCNALIFRAKYLLNNIKCLFVLCKQSA